jgi:hypothetical protein
MTTPAEVTREHRERAAELHRMADGTMLGHHYAEWIVTGERDENSAHYGELGAAEHIAQAIADAEARGRAGERARLLANCTYYSVDGWGDTETHETLEEAESDAESALDQALDNDGIWAERTGDICYGAMVCLGEAHACNRRESDRPDCDEIIDFVLKETGATLGTELHDTALDLLQRICKYAIEDKAVTPGFTRLDRALAQASALLKEHGHG